MNRSYLNLAKKSWAPSFALFLLPAMSPPLYSADEGVLELSQLEQIAVQHDPRLAATRAQLDATQAMAETASELPDPVVRLGLNNLPYDDFSLDREPMTQVLVTARQTLPSRDLRRARANTKGAVVEQAKAQSEQTRSTVLRELRQHWLKGWSAQAERKLLERQLSVLDAQREVVLVGVKTGLSEQSVLVRLALRQGALREHLLELDGELAAARASLTRWGVSSVLAQWPSALPKYLETSPERPNIEHAPRLQQALAQLKQAEKEVELANLAYRPDWTLDAGYGYREDRVDFLTVGVSVALPLFPDRRQDKQLAARQATRVAAMAAMNDLSLQLTAELDQHYALLFSTSGRIDHIQDHLIPTQKRLLSVLEAEAQTMQGQLASVFQERLNLIELEKQQLALATQRAKHVIETLYIIGGQS